MKRTIVATAAASLLLAGCGGAATPPPSPPTTTDTAATLRANQAAANAKLDAAQKRLDEAIAAQNAEISKACTDQVLTRLKSPASAKFPDLKVTPDPAKDSTFTVTGTVRSLNPMGVPLDASVGCTSILDGTTLRTTWMGPYAR